MTDAASFPLLFGTSNSQDSLFVSQNNSWMKPRREMGWGWGQSGSCRRRRREAASSGQECVLLPARRGAVFVCSGLNCCCIHNVPQHLTLQSGLFPNFIPAPCGRTSPSGSFAKEEISRGFSFAGKAWKSTATAPDIARSLRSNTRPGAVEEERYLSLERFMTFGWNWKGLFCKAHVAGIVQG